MPYGIFGVGNILARKYPHDAAGHLNDLKVFRLTSVQPDSVVEQRTVPRTRGDEPLPATSTSDYELLERLSRSALHTSDPDRKASSWNPYPK
jgi:hypothetical protein